MENIILTNNKDLRLVGVKVGVLSTLRLELPLVSESATHVEVIVTSGNVHSAYTATFISDTKRWQCDIAASQFPAVGKQSYEVAYVLDGKQFWDGKGWIEIEDATTSGIEPQPRPEPYRYAVVSVNGYGADSQGAVRIPKTFIAANSPATTEGYMEGDIYFNRETGATWTLCDVQGTLTWVFNYKNYYTKAETEKAIDRVAAYYITYDAAGNPFPTYAALANAQTVYSGGAVRVPTRNDYCVVLADETHDNAEYRYIYAVAEGQTTGSWQPQFPVEGVMTIDPTVTRNSQNPVSGGGVWSAIWGALAALPTGFSSLYDWCVAQLAGKVPTSRTVNGKALANDVTLTGADIAVSGTDATKINAALAGKASKADATLTPIYGDTWVISPSVGPHGKPLQITYGVYWSPTTWALNENTYPGQSWEAIGNPPADAISLTFDMDGTTVVATRQTAEHVVVGYILGPDEQTNPNRNKPLASEAEAEALRTGKQDALSAQQLANIAAVPGKANNADVVHKSGDTMTGNLKVTGSQTRMVIVGENDTNAYVALNQTGIIRDGTANNKKLIFPENGGTFALIQNIAPDYDGETSHTYAVNELRAYHGFVYRCTTAHTAKSWIAANWALAPVEDILAALRAGKADKPVTFTTGNLAALDASGNPTDSGVKASDKLDSTSAAPAFSTDSSVSYPVGSHCTYNGKLYKCTTATTGGTWDASKWTADTMIDPDAVLDITAQNQLRVVAKDGTLLWAQGYDLASTSSATLACDAVNNFTFADGATSQAFALPTAPTGKVGDFGLDIDNSANTGAATMTLTGLDTTFSVVVPEGESLTDMLAIAAGELARFYITLSTFRVNNLPTWHIVKQVVENGGAQS